MRRITALCDYQNRFGSKFYDQPYRSGMDKALLSKYFNDAGYNIEFQGFSDVDFSSGHKDDICIYTSQEDIGYHYKGFIEDIVFGLEGQGAIVIPGYKYLHATNNKVYMEILRQLSLPEFYRIRTGYYGTVEEVIKHSGTLNYPQVIKTAAGAGSHGVFLAKNQKELKRIVKKVARTRYCFEELWDYGRSIIHKGYIRESLYRRKFITQDFIEGLNNDWKVLIFMDRLYVLRRNNRPRDFRASGSGLFIFDKEVDEDLLNAASDIFHSFDIPMLSLDLAKKDGKVLLVEMQFVYFGTSTLEKSPYYYTRINNAWQQIHTKSNLEEVYSESIVKFIDKLQSTDT